MSNKDLFAPPTKEEQETILAAPTAEELAQFSEPKKRPIAAAAQGLANAFGFADEAGALVEKGLNLLPGSPDRINQKLLEEGFNGDVVPKSFDDLVAENRASREQLKKDNPIPYGAGVTFGTLGTAGLGLGAKATQALGKAAPVVMSSIQGAVEGVSESEGTLNQDPGQVIADGVKGLGLGTVFGVGGNYLGDLLQNSSNALKKSSQESALKSLGLKSKDLKKIKGNNKDFEKLLSLGQKSMDEGVVTAFSTPESKFEKLKELIDKREALLSSKLKEIDSALEQTPELLEGFGTNKAYIREQAIENFKRKNLEASDVSLNKFTEALDNLITKTGDPKILNASKLQAKKLALNDAGKYNKIDDVAASVDAARELRKQYKQAIENYGNLAKTTGKDTGEIANLNKDLGDLYSMRKAAEDNVLKDLSSGKLSASDQAGIGLSLLTGNPSALVASGVIDGAKRFGSGINAVTKQKASNFAKSLIDPISSKAVPLSSINQTLATTAGKVSTEKAVEDNKVSSIADLDSNEIQILAEKALANPEKESQELAELLNEASSKTGIAKTINIFKIMQNPKYRNKLKELKEEPKE